VTGFSNSLHRDQSTVLSGTFTGADRLDHVNSDPRPAFQRPAERSANPPDHVDALPTLVFGQPICGVAAIDRHHRQRKQVVLPHEQGGLIDFPYGAGVPATLKHHRSRGPVREQRLTEGSGETADCITDSDVLRRFGCRAPWK
jgi:hypothetical protein